MTELPDSVPALQKEIRRLRQWIDDLQSGMYINCVYCGHRYGPRSKVPASMALVLKQHIAECPQHPMHDLLIELKAGRDLVQSAYAHVSHAGPTREEASSWLQRAIAAIEKAQSPS